MLSNAGVSYLAGVEWTMPRSKLLYISAVASIVAAEVVLGLSLFRHHTYPDYVEYLNMVTGNYGPVTEPFASRILGPLLAGWISSSLHFAPQASLALVCAVPWLLSGIPIGALLYKSDVPLEWAAVVAITPFPMAGASYYLVPDGLYVLALLCFLAFWEGHRPLMTGLSAACAVIARGSGIVGIGLWTLVGFFYAKKSRILATVIGVVLGFLLIHLHGTHGASNVHRLNPLLYFALKIPVNFVGNLIGLHPYVNTYPYCTSPIVTWRLPHLAALGNISTIGACPFNGKAIVGSIACYLFILGFVPILIVSSALKAWPVKSEIYRSAPFVVLFLLAPGLGLTVDRLYVEAFPFMFPIVGASLATLGLKQDRRWRNRALAYSVASNLVMMVFTMMVFTYS